MVGESGVGLDGADGGDELAASSYRWGGGGSGGAGSTGAVGAAPARGVGERGGLREAGGVPWRRAGGAAEQFDLGRGGRAADHANAISVAGEVRHGGARLRWVGGAGTGEGLVCARVWLGGPEGGNVRSVRR